MKIRFLSTKFHTAAENMAIDEAVLNEIASGNSLPTLRLYGWQPAAISIGYFQSLKEEIDLEACETSGIDYVRRITGGGAVLHEHEITYSIHIPESENVIPNGILESYQILCGAVINGLTLIGIDAKFIPINDLVVTYNGTPQKISGNAQTRKKGIILQHGTILLKVDVDKMFSLLKVPDEKMKGKLINDVKQRVTSVSTILARDIPFEEAHDFIYKGFQNTFPSFEFTSGELTNNEKNSIPLLVKDKYGNDDWNNKR